MKFQFLVEFIFYAAAKQQGADTQLTVAPSHTFGTLMVSNVYISVRRIISGVNTKMRPIVVAYFGPSKFATGSIRTAVAPKIRELLNL